MTKTFKMIPGLFGLILLLGVLGAKPAAATHFRYGTISWVPNGTPTAGSFPVKFSLSCSFRRSSPTYTGTAPDKKPAVGDIITETQGPTNFIFGDGKTTATLQFKVTAINLTEDWLVGDALDPGTTNVGITHTYTTAGPFLAGISSGTRVSNLNNGALGNYVVETRVYLANGNRSPVSTMVPILTVANSTNTTFSVPAFDPDGDYIRWRFATAAEAGITGNVPPGMTLNNATGQVTWNTATSGAGGTPLNQTNFWTVQFIIEDFDTAGNLKSNTPVDVMLKISSALGTSPALEIHTAMAGQPQHGPITVTYGTPVSFHVEGSDIDTDSTVTLNGSGLPAGATMSPTLPFTGPSGPPSFPDVISDLSWTPTQAQIGSHVISFSATDNTGLQTLASMTVNVINDAIIASDDSYTALNNQTLNVPVPGVLANDTTTGVAPLHAVLVSNPSHGTLTLNPDGSFSYTATAGYVGADSFNYKANDGTVDSNFATVNITVQQGNYAPVATDQSATTNEDTAVPITLAASDADNDPLTYSIITNPGHGTLSGTGANLIYTPDKDYNGTDSFTFKVNDGKVDSNTATVDISIAPVNDAPVAQNGTASTDEDTPVSGNLVAIDIDSPTLTYSTVSDPAHGTVTVNADGSFTYTPAADYNGSDSFTFKANDGSLDSKTATVSITVNPVNDRPVATDGTASTTEDSSGIDINLGALVSDVETAPADLTYNVVSGPSASQGTLTATTPNGHLTFKPAADYNGTVTFTYNVTDTGDGASAALTSETKTVTITVTEVNDKPVATDDNKTTAEDNALTFPSSDLTANDNAGPANESGQTLTVTAVTAGANTHGTVALATDGSITYTPEADYNGPASFSYQVTDNGTTNGAADPQSATGTVNVNVTEVNDAPTAADDKKSLLEDQTLTFPGSDLTANDAKGPANESGQTLTVVAVGTAAHGTVALTNGSITYTPAAIFNGSDSFTYTVQDNGTTKGVADPKSATAKVCITVTAVNDVPGFTGGANQSVDEDSGAQSVAKWATAISAGPADEAGQKLNFIVSNDKNNLFAAQPAVDAAGTLTYTPAANANGLAKVTVKLHDNGGTANGGVDTSDAQTFVITIRPVNDRPVATDKALSTPEDTNLDVNLRSLVSDVETAPADLTYNVVSGPSASQGTLTATTPNGHLTFKPAADYNGTVTFTYNVTDTGDPAGALGNKLSSDTKTVTIKVTEVNDAPVALDDTATAPAYVDSTSMTSINVLSNDKPGPANESSQTLKVTAVTNGAHGAVVINADGKGVTYIPDDDNYLGADSFTYTVQDNGTTNGVADPKSATAKVNVNVVLPATTPGAKATGSGAISTHGGLAAFDINALVQSDGRLQGSLSYNDSKSNMMVKSTSLTAIVVHGTHARIFGKASINGLGSYPFVADVVDNGEPRSADTFRLTINGYTAGAATLERGNLQVH